MSAGTARSRGFRYRSVVQQLVGPALQHSPIQVSRQPPTSGVHDQPQVQAAMSLSHSIRLAEHAHRPDRTHAPDEGHAPDRQLLPLRRHDKARGQLPQPQSPAVLRRRLTPQPRVDVLGVDRLLKPRQFPPQVARPGVAPVEQPWLEPAIEVLHAAVELRLPFRDEDRTDAEAQAEPDDPRQAARRRPPAGQLAGVVELDLLGDAEILPALAEEPEDLVHAAGIGQAQADGAVEGVLAHPDVVAVAAALEVDRPHEIDLVEFVGDPGLWTGVLLAWQQRSQADAGRGQAVALQDAIDGPSTGERADAQGLQFGEDGSGPGQAVAGRRVGVGLEPASDGEDGPLQLGGDALGDMVVGPRQVVEALGPGLQVAAPPLVEPDLGAADGGADGLDGPAGESQGNGAMTSGKFVVHGYLRVAAAGGCPWR